MVEISEEEETILRPDETVGSTSDTLVRIGLEKSTS